MNKNPGTKQFWRLCGPILLYWGIEFVVKLMAEIVVMAPQFGEIMSESLASGAVTQDELMNLMQQYMGQIYETLLKYQVQILAIGAICTIPLTFYLFHADRRRERELQVPLNKKAKLWRYALVIGLGIAVCIGLNCLSIMSNLAFASADYQKTSETFYSASIPLQFICLGLIVPITEELMFRGVLYKRYREQGSFFKAALCSTLLFSLTHGNVVQFLYTFALGFFLAYVYEKFGSFKAPVVLHIVVNMTSLIVTNAGGFNWLTSKASRMGIITVLCAFVGSVMFVLIQRIDERPEETEPPKPDKITPDMFR